MYKKESLQKVLDVLGEKSEWGVTELALRLGKHRNLMHRYLKELVRMGKVYKKGSGAHVVYMLAEGVTNITPLQPIDDIPYMQYADIQLLQKFFTKFSPTGKRLDGKHGFVEWCRDRGFDPEEKLKDFVSIAKYVQSLHNECGLLDVSDTFHEHIEGGSIKRLYYADQYTWMDFGRGKLAEITFYGKDMQERKLIDEAIALIIDKIHCMIHEYDISAIAFTPHSRRRSIQLLQELEKKVETGIIPQIQLIKYAPHGLSIAQKSLKKRTERIRNARDTILVDADDLTAYRRVLLIDDFVGSGATLNETAKKLKALGVKEVYGFAFVGNANLSYDVIREI